MLKIFCGSVRRTFLLALAMTLSAGAASAGSVADFYRGKQLTLLVGYSPGGGFDTRARILAEFMGRHIPGNPEIIVQNMPGAGSKKLANHLYNVAPRDGTVFGVINETMATNPLFEVPGTDFDALKFTWLGSLLKDPSICFAWHDSGIETMDDLMIKEFIVGATGTGSPSYILPTSMHRFLGVNIQAIPGYKGSNGVLHAIELGEVQGMCGMNWQSLKAMRPGWISEGKVTVIGQMGPSKDPKLPKVPSMLDLVKDDKAREAWRLLFVGKLMANPYVAPPEIPEDRKQALRRAFDTTMEDPAFLSQIQDLGLTLRPNTGEEVDAILRQAYAAPDHIVDIAAEALQQ